MSTQRQAQQQTSEQQLERLRAQIAQQGWELREEAIVRDDGYSGATLRRPGLDRWIAGSLDRWRAAAFDLVLLTAPDRLARNYVHQMAL